MTFETAFATNRKAKTHQLNSRPQIRLDLGHDLDLDFSRSNMEFAISQPKMVRLLWDKSKHIDGTLSLKCNNQVLPWHWPWIFKVKFGICYISVKSGPIATKWKWNLLIELWASNVNNGYDLGHDFDLDFSTSNVTIIFDHTDGLYHGFSWSTFEISVSQEWDGRLTLHKGDGSLSFMTMAFWWPKWGARCDFRCQLAVDSSGFTYTGNYFVNYKVYLRHKQKSCL